MRGGLQRAVEGNWGRRLYICNITTSQSYGSHEAMEKAPRHSVKEETGLLQKDARPMTGFPRCFQVNGSP